VRFARAKFRPPVLPATLIARSLLHGRLNDGTGRRLTLVVGAAGAGKSVLLSSWAAARPPGMTSWLSCDGADASPARFWSGFIEAIRVTAPWFGADADDLLAMDRAVSADFIASLANDAGKLPAGSAVILDDFHVSAAAVAEEMTDLVERWPVSTVQLVLAGRADPPLRLHRMRVAGELCELRARDLYFTPAESRELLTRFSVQVSDEQLAVLHERTEGWTAAVQMAALSLRGTDDPKRIARALEVRGQAIADYFMSEVLNQHPPELAQFMLDTSILDELTADVCTAVTAREDAAALLRAIGAAHLFLVTLDGEERSFRYHHLVRQLLRDELHARNPAREWKLQLRAAEWFEAQGDARQAAHYFLAVRQADRALTLMESRVVPDFLDDPVVPPPLDLGLTDPALLSNAPDLLLTVAADVLVAGDTVRGGRYLSLLERVQPPIPRESRVWARWMAFRAVRHVLLGEAEEAVSVALAARAVKERGQLNGDWSVVAPMILPTAYTWLEDYPAVEREAAATLAAPELTEPVKVVMVPGVRASAWFEAGYLKRAGDMARAAQREASRLGFDRHFFAVDYLRTLAGLALERRDFGAADELTEHALSIAERRRPMFEFLVLLDRASAWAAREDAGEALAAVAAARRVLAGTRSVLLTRADELESLIRTRLGERHHATELASGLPRVRRHLLLARIALASGDQRTATEQLRVVPSDNLTPRHALTRQLLLAAAAVRRGDPMAAGLMGRAVQAARQGGYLNTVVSVAPEVTTFLMDRAAQAPRDPFAEQLITAGLDVRSAQGDASSSGDLPAASLTAAERRILKLLPTNSYLQIAETLFISHNTVKSHLRSIYQKLGVESRAQAVERALELRLLSGL
jgi:LuxR family maltose regulon positive regulatory protein